MGMDQDDFGFHTDYDSTEKSFLEQTFPASVKMINIKRRVKNFGYCRKRYYRHLKTAATTSVKIRRMTLKSATLPKCRKL